MAEGDSKKKRNTAGEESQAVNTDGGDEDFDIFAEPNDAYDEDEKQGGGGWGDLQECDDDFFQESHFEESQVKPGRTKD